MRIAVFFHCFLFSGDPPELNPQAFAVVNEQMSRMNACGLTDGASDITIGLNGGGESLEVGGLVFPPKARVFCHGLQSKCENPTILLMEDWLKCSREEAFVLYFHAKGSSRNLFDPYGQFESRWRECMMSRCVDNWAVCVNDLLTYEAAGCHWLTEKGWDRSQNYFAGTFFWARASFLRTLPSIQRRHRIQSSGLGALDSRYEAEVWIGNGPRLPFIKDYHPGWPPAKHGWPPSGMIQ